MKEYSGLSDGQIRREVLPHKQPAVLRGLVRDWRAVREFLQSPGSLVNYLRAWTAGRLWMHS